jgi:hypothetical protein
MGELDNKMDNRVSISRRELLKLLAASGGAMAAAAFLPASWTRPLVQSGVLPAHAQASCIVEAEVTDTVQGSGIPGGFGAIIQYSPTSYTPTSSQVHWGGYGVPSTLDPITSGSVRVSFAHPGVQLNDCTVEIILTFNQICDVTLEFEWCIQPPD